MNERNLARGKAILDDFVRSEYAQEWISQAVQGDYSIDGRGARCADAAEQGADGSTHGEVIDDWRDAWACWLYHDRPGASCWKDMDRVNDAMSAAIDACEQWHADNGSLDTEIG